MREAYSPGDPMRAAQANMRPQGLRRFYKSVSLSETSEGFALLLDGKPAKTPGQHKLVAGTRHLGDLLTAEWQRQGERIEPADMPVTRIVNSAIDGGAGALAPLRAEIAKFAGADLLCYRAAEPQLLAQAQRDAFDPVLDWAAQALGARFHLSHSLVHVAQPPESLLKVRAALDAIADPAALVALHVATTLTGSALLALALWRGAYNAQAIWRIADIDEDFQIEQWGADEDANARRAARWREMTAAEQVLDAVR